MHGIFITALTLSSSTYVASNCLEKFSVFGRPLERALRTMCRLFFLLACVVAKLYVVESRRHSAMVLV